MSGATETESGRAGLVPIPLSEDRYSFLRGDGKWVDPGFYDIISNINTTLDSVREETKNRIDYYDNIADIALENVDDRLENVVKDVEEHGETKKTEITEVTDTKKEEISTLTEEKKDDISTLTEEKKEELAETTATKTDEIVQSVSDTANDRVDTLDGMVTDFHERVLDALDSEHPTQRITREDGIHGIRYTESTLEYEDDDGNWNVVDDKSTTVFHSDASEYEDVEGINADLIIGLKDIAKTGILTLTDDVTGENYVLGIANGRLYIKLLDS
jgi:hypothetical protein